ncbi:FkbM family methyltransferase, partial [Thermodesulfobacteriota bacterium]
GAGEGTYALKIRETGYSKRIISFEPLSQSFSVLQQRSESDPLWKCEKLAIGDSDSTIDINISGHKTSSSILPMTEAHIQAMVTSDSIGKEKVRIARLDSLSDKVFSSSERICLKIDVQGYEKHVLQCAAETLKRTYMIELELSLTQMYEGGTLIDEMLDYLSGMSFKLASIEPVFLEAKTGIVLQADGIFVKRCC